MDHFIEFALLSTEAGTGFLTEVGRVARPGPADLARWRKQWPGDSVRAALRLAEARRKGQTKFRHASVLWLDPIGVEQATAEDVARHKAARFQGSECAVDLCSGIGSDASALSAVCPTIAVDLDQGMASRTRWNARILGVADRLLAVRSSAERFPIPNRARVHIDPDRRFERSARARDIDGYAPGLPYLQHLIQAQAGGAIKLSPSSGFADHFSAPGLELELISLKGECKEATVWFGDLAGQGVSRRATSLPSGATWSSLDGPLGETQLSRPLGPWVFDPDPALVRSGLLDGFAESHGLARIRPGVDLLTGSELLKTPFLSPFEVLEVLPLDLRVLKREVAARGLGPLEIKTRGLETTPEAYRARLRAEGSQPATLLLIAGRNEPSTAILARRPPLSEVGEAGH